MRGWGGAIGYGVRLGVWRGVERDGVEVRMCGVGVLGPRVGL